MPGHCDTVQPKFAVPAIFFALNIQVIVDYNKKYFGNPFVKRVQYMPLLHSETRNYTPSLKSKHLGYMKNDIICLVIQHIL